MREKVRRLVLTSPGLAPNLGTSHSLSEQLGVFYLHFK